MAALTSVRVLGYGFVLAGTVLLSAGGAIASERGLIAYWSLAGDCRDHSGNGHDGTNHNVNLQTSEFNGRDRYVEIPDSPELQLGTGAFSATA